MVAAKMGLLIQEEAFDTWYGGKKEYDYGRFFEEEATHPEAKAGDFWSDYDLRTMIDVVRTIQRFLCGPWEMKSAKQMEDAHSLRRSNAC